MLSGIDARVFLQWEANYGFLSRIEHVCVFPSLFGKREIMLGRTQQNVDSRRHLPQKLPERNFIM